jgi:hypothetical protein
MERYGKEAVRSVWLICTRHQKQDYIFLSSISVLSSLDAVLLEVCICPFQRLAKGAEMPN